MVLASRLYHMSNGTNVGQHAARQFLKLLQMIIELKWSASDNNDLLSINLTCCDYVSIRASVSMRRNCIFIFLKAWEWDGGAGFWGGVGGCAKDGEAERKRRIGLTAHVFAACQPLLGGDLVRSMRTQAWNYFAKNWTVRTINPERIVADQSGCEWVVLCSCRVLIRGSSLPLLPPSVTDEYKMKGVEKVKYMSGDEGGVDGQDSTVRDSIPHFVF